MYLFCLAETAQNPPLCWVCSERHFNTTWTSSSLRGLSTFHSSILMKTINELDQCKKTTKKHRSHCIIYLMQCGTHGAQLEVPSIDYSDSNSVVILDTLTPSLP